MLKRVIITIITLIFISEAAKSQEVTVSGHVKDEDNGEVLIGVNVYLKGMSVGAASNSYGFYSLTVPKGRQTVVFSYLGYQPEELDLNIQSDTTINV